MIYDLGNFLNRLRRDTAANTLVILGIALIPLAAMVGSAVDISRAYMAKSKLQSACDSASLAARRVMRDDTFTDEVDETGKEFFAFNFPQETFGAAAFEPVVSRPEQGIVQVEAETTIPTILMHIFGFGSLPISVTCEASLNFVNTDVMLVLDVTGSMADSVGGSPKIDSLREAVMALYDELAPVQDQLQSQGLRLRYGFVPYSSTVNVGRLLYAENPDYIRSSTTYPSRVANYTTQSFTANTPTSTGSWEVHNNSLNKSECKNWVESSDSTSGTAPGTTTRVSYRGTAGSSNYVENENYSYPDAPDTSGSSRSCRRWRVVETTTYTMTSNFERTNWTYRDETYNTSTFKQPGGTITLATNAAGIVPASGSYNSQQLAAAGTGVGTTSVSWNGCIEERDTSTAITGTTSMTIPGTAYDLDINRIPTSTETTWRPQMPDAVYTRTAGSTSTNSNANSSSTTGWIKNYNYDQGYWACPTQAERLDEFTREEVEDYVDGLQTVGGTYHDIGMIWGARMISTDGVFADGCEEYNGMPCNRHIIFMTDGAQTTYCNVLTAYGVEQNDRRTTGSGSCTNQQARHEQRFRMICNAAKNMNVSVWVVAFDTGLNSNLQGCATNSNQASTATNQAALIARFRQIGNQIGALRLVS